MWDRLGAQLGDLKMAGALEALDDVLRRSDAVELSAPTAIEQPFGANMTLRNLRRQQTAMCIARLPDIKTLADFGFRFSPPSSASNSRACTRCASSSAQRTSSCSGHRG